MKIDMGYGKRMKDEGLRRWDLGCGPSAEFTLSEVEGLGVTDVGDGMKDEGLRRKDKG